MSSRPYASTDIALTVIIVNHYSEAVLGDCLAALAAGASADHREVIIVDNPAREEAPVFPIPAGLDVRRVKAPKRLGFAAACNLGAETAGGRYLLFLNPDVRVESSALTRLMAMLVEHLDIGAVVGRLTGPDRAFQPTCRRFPTITRLIASRGSMLRRIVRFPEDAYTLPDYPAPTDVDAAAAAMMMLPKNIYNRLGGFDPSFFMYMEDTDLCYRLREAGYRTVYIPEAEGVHLWGHATRRYRFRRLIWHHRSVWHYFARRETSWANRLLLGPALAANCLLSLTAELCTLRP